MLVVTFLNCGCPKCPTILKNNPSNPVCGLGLWCWLSPSSIVGVRSVVEAAGWPPAPWHFGGSSRQNHGVPFKSTVSISISISISLPDMSSTSNQYDKEEVRKTGCCLQVAVLYCLRCKTVKYLPVVNNPPSSDRQIQRAAHLVYLGYLPPPPPSTFSKENRKGFRRPAGIWCTPHSQNFYKPFRCTAITTNTDLCTPTPHLLQLY